MRRSSFFISSLLFLSNSAFGQLDSGNYKFKAQLGTSISVNAKVLIKTIRVNEKTPAFVDGRMSINDEGKADFLICGISIDGKKVKAKFRDQNRLIGHIDNVNIDETFNLRIRSTKASATVNFAGKRNVELSGPVELTMKWPELYADMLDMDIEPESTSIRYKPKVSKVTKLAKVTVNVRENTAAKNSFRIEETEVFSCRE